MTAHQLFSHLYPEFQQDHGGLYGVAPATGLWLVIKDDCSYAEAQLWKTGGLLIPEPKVARCLELQLPLIHCAYQFQCGTIAHHRFEVNRRLFGLRARSWNPTSRWPGWILRWSEFTVLSAADTARLQPIHPIGGGDDGSVHGGNSFRAL